MQRCYKGLVCASYGFLDSGDTKKILYCKCRHFGDPRRTRKRDAKLVVRSAMAAQYNFMEGCVGLPQLLPQAEQWKYRSPSQKQQSDDFR